MSDQLSLELNDSRLELAAIIANTHLGTYSSWRVFYLPNSNTLWLGIRTHYYETDYDYIKKISLEDAKWLLSKRVHKGACGAVYVSDFMYAIEHYEKRNQ